MKPVRTPRAAVVGAGLMGRWHADAICRVGGTLTLIVDPSAARAEHLAARFPTAQASADLRESLGRLELEVVHLCTPVETHASLTALALEAGKHVLVEKPLAPDAATTTSLLQQAQRQRRLLCPVHQMVFQAGVRQAADALHEVGPLLQLEFVACTAGAEGRPESERDAVVREILPHPLALFRRLLGQPLPTVWQTHHPRAGELRASSELGAVGLSILISTQARPTINALRLFGARGTIEMDLFHGFATVDRGEVSRRHKVVHPYLRAARLARAATTNLLARAVQREFAYPGLRELVRQLYTAIRADRPSPITAQETYDVALARDSLLAAFQEGAARRGASHGTRG
jgi:predicted dehydrogenase